MLTFSHTQNNNHGGSNRVFFSRFWQNQGLDRLVVDLSVGCMVWFGALRSLYSEGTAQTWRKHHIWWVKLKNTLQINHICLRIIGCFLKVMQCILQSIQFKWMYCKQEVNMQRTVAGEPISPMHWKSVFLKWSVTVMHRLLRVGEPHHVHQTFTSPSDKMQMPKEKRITWMNQRLSKKAGKEEIVDDEATRSTCSQFWSDLGFS